MKKTSLVFLLLLFVAVGSVYTQWQINGVAVCDTIGNQYIAANGILSDGASGAFVVWGDNRDGWDIYAQRVDSSGRMLWGRQGKPICSAPGWQFAPYVTPDGEGGFVVAWHDARNDSRDVYAQRVDKNGNLLWDENGLLVIHYTQFQGVTDIIRASDSTFIVVWRDDRFFPDSAAIYIQKLNRDGKKLWQDDGVRVSDDPGSPRLLSDGNGGAFVIWAGGNTKNMFVQHITKNGERLWEFPGKICSEGTAEWLWTDFSVCPDGHGGLYVAWDYDYTDHTYIQRIDSSGNILWGDNGIQIISNEISQQHPSIITYSDSLIYLWQDNFFVRMQVFSKLGTRKFFPLGLKLTNYKSSRYISTVIEDGKILLSHPAIINFIPNEFIIKAQKTNTSGFLFWDSSGVTVSNIEIAPSVVRGFSVSDGKGGIIAAWDDNRNEIIKTDIYIQRVYAECHVGGDSATAIKSFKIPVAQESGFKISHLYPNPFNSVVTMKFRLLKSGELGIKVFNVLGEAVKDYGRKHYPAGEHRLSWDGRNNNGKEVSSGIYIIRFTTEGRIISRKLLLLK